MGCLDTAKAVVSPDQVRDDREEGEWLKAEGIVGKIGIVEYLAGGWSLE